MKWDYEKQDEDYPDLKTWKEEDIFAQTLLTQQSNLVFDPPDHQGFPAIGRHLRPMMRNIHVCSEESTPPSHRCTFVSSASVIVGNQEDDNSGPTTHREHVCLGFAISNIDSTTVDLDSSWWETDSLMEELEPGTEIGGPSEDCSARNEGNHHHQPQQPKKKRLDNIDDKRCCDGSLASNSSSPLKSIDVLDNLVIAQQESLTAQHLMKDRKTPDGARRNGDDISNMALALNKMSLAEREKVRMYFGVLRCNYFSHFTTSSFRSVSSQSFPQPNAYNHTQHTGFVRFARCIWLFA
jgi:hypothetical protein